VGWLSFFVIYAGTIATLAAGFAAGLANFVPLGKGGQVAVAVAVTLGASAINFVGVRWGAVANNTTGFVKLAALAAFDVLGLAFGAGDLDGLRSAPGAATEITFAVFGLALSPVLFSYLGWNSSIYVASEIRDPARNLPRSLFLGVGICTLVYLAVNVVYLYAVPMADLRGEINAGEAAARALFGGVGGTLAAAFVLVSILGTLNATVLVGPRIAYAMALDRLFFPGVDRAHVRFGTPTVSITLQAVIATGILLALETFERALDYTVFAILIATMADVAALYRLRRKQPDRPRPYRAWGYPWLPGLYFVANGAIAVALLVGSPRDCLFGLAIAAAGLPFYWFFARRNASGSGGPGGSGASRA
jgi:APA family basic amino acid/polyamine antiporter